MRAAIKKEVKNILGSSQHSSKDWIKQKWQKSKMNDIKLAVLGGERTGKSGEW
jgi:hypothetical protein